MFSHKVPNFAQRRILPFLNATTAHCALENCGVRGRLVLTLWPYIGECRKQRWDGRERRWSVKPCQWSAELGGEEGRKVPLKTAHGKTFGISLYKYQICRLFSPNDFVCALLDMNNFGLECLLFSVKHPVQGQCLSLESHIAVCKPCRRG